MARLMKYMTRLENSIPTPTSHLAYRSSPSVAPRRSHSRRRPGAFSSSTSWLACQKNRYGEMVVPRMATRVTRYGASNRTAGTSAPRAAAAQSGRAKAAAPL